VRGRAKVASTVVQFHGVSHVYPSGRVGLSGLDLAVTAGERVGLIGPSGAGKSTLLRLSNGLLTPTEGAIRVLGEEVRSLTEAGRMALRRRVGMVFQEFALIERLPVLTNVLVGRLGYTKTLPSLFRLFGKADVERAVNAVARVGLAGYEEQLVRNLSGGQKQRVGIARALAQEAQVILGDEPTANLDVRTADDILSLLVSVADERNTTLILSLHDVRAARKFCTRIVALKAGRLAWDGPAADFTDVEMEQVFY
jgi:phosphonate transport system ATP-binding protein